ncbi:MAG: Lin1244/Lin1753 domain-containing protein, partial [Aliarcobacter sp.]
MPEEEKNVRLGYIKHDINASDDDKLIQLQVDFGFSGLGFYWRLLELIYRNEGRLAKKSSVSIGERGGMRKKASAEMVDEMVSLGLFHEDGGNLISDRAMEDIRACMDKQETYRNNSNARWNKNKGMDDATATDKGMQRRCNCMKGDDETALQPPRTRSSDSCSRSDSGSIS